MLQLSQSAHDQLRRHEEAAYPHESCGILLGAINGGCKQVTGALPVLNSSPTPHNRYEIAPTDLIRASRQALHAGLEIVGFYHSHPDHLADPSATDLAEAHWLGHSYLITAVRKGRADETRSFHLAGSIEDEKNFRPEEVRILE